MRRAAKVDRNQAEIVKHLRWSGFDVDLVHQLKGLYDIIVTGLPVWSHMPVALRVEIKMPGEKLTPAEQEYWNQVKHPGNLIVAESVEDILKWFGRI